MNKMCFIYGRVTEAAFPQMTSPSVPRIDEVGVAAMGLGEGTAQPMLVRGHDNDVHVIWHQAVAPYLATCLFGGFGEDVTIEGIVAVAEEGLLTAITALGHMMRDTGNDEARQTSHGARVTQSV